MPRDVDGLVDEIDRLVDEQLAQDDSIPRAYCCDELQPMHPLNAIPAAVAAVAVLGAIIWPVLLVRELWDRVTGTRFR